MPLLQSSKILEEILMKLNAWFRRENRKILLVMDMASCQPEDLGNKFSQIKVAFYPKTPQPPHAVCSHSTLGSYKHLNSSITSSCLLKWSARWISAALHRKCVIQLIFCKLNDGLLWHGMMFCNPQLWNVLSRQGFWILKGRRMQWKQLVGT